MQRRRNSQRRITMHSAMKTLHVHALRLALASAAAAMVALTALAVSTIATAQPLTMTTGPFIIAADEVAGPYRLTVHQSPERVIVGTLTYAVQVRLASDDSYVDDAVVRVYGTPSGRGERQVAPALNNPAEPEYYLGRMEVEEHGVWAIDIVVEHPEHGYASTALALEIFERSRGGSNLVLGTTLWVLVSLAFIGAVGYLLLIARRNRQRLKAQRTT